MKEHSPEVYLNNELMKQSGNFYNNFGNYKNTVKY